VFLHVSRHLTGAAMDTDLAIGELAKQAGVSVETVRFYERIGQRELRRRHAPARHRAVVGWSAEVYSAGSIAPGNFR